MYKNHVINFTIAESDFYKYESEAFQWCIRNKIKPGDVLKFSDNRLGIVVGYGYYDIEVFLYKDTHSTNFDNFDNITKITKTKENIESNIWYHAKDALDRYLTVYEDDVVYNKMTRNPIIKEVAKRTEFKNNELVLVSVTGYDELKAANYSDSTMDENSNIIYFCHGIDATFNICIPYNDKYVGKCPCNMNVKDN